MSRVTCRFRWILLVLVVCLDLGQAGEVPFSLPLAVPLKPGTSLIGDIALADFSGNGYGDIVGASFVRPQAQVNIEFWFNNPPWQTNGGSSIATSLQNLAALAVGDLDRNGEPDVVVCGPSGLNQFMKWYGPGPHPIANTVVDQIELADVDGDGDLDVIGGNGTGNVSWWENTGNTNADWPAHWIGQMPATRIHCEAADLDGDGDTDIVTSLSESSPSLVWWENDNGQGTIWHTHPISSTYNGNSWPRAMDLDRDGDLDVVASTDSTPGVCWWENTHGNATSWTEHPLISGFDNTGPSSVVDLDKDSDLDIVATELNGEGMVWWENRRGQPLGWLRHALPADSDLHAGTPEIGDFDRDGDPDIIYRTAEAIHWLPNQTIHRNAVFPRKELVADFFDGVTCACTADLNGDGLTDILGAASVDGEIRVWLGTGFASAPWWSSTVDLDADGIGSLFTADLDGDGDLDILGAAFSANAIRWWENTGGGLPSWTSHIIATGFMGAQDVKAADLDGDGDLDVVGAAYLQNRVSWWENDGTPADGGWVFHNLSLAFGGAYAIAVADLDRDGDVDIVGAANASNQIAWWENSGGTGTPTFSPHSIDANVHHPVSVDLADIDRDGDLDVIGAAFDAGQVFWWENVAGSPLTWLRHLVGPSTLAGAIDAHAADVDNDGDPDVVGAGYGEGRLQWWENIDGKGSEWLVQTNGLSLPNARSLYVADLDQDGDLDLLGTGGSANDQIVWWPNRGGQFALTTTKVGPATLVDAQTAALLAIDFAHLGRAGDSIMELATLELLLEQSPGNPLTQTEAAAILDAVTLYCDDGNGWFDVEDTAVQTFPNPFLNQGVATLSFYTGLPSASLEPGTTQRFFVAVTTTENAHAQTPNHFRITHLTESSSTVRDQGSGVSLLMAFSPDVASDLCVIQSPLRIHSIVRQPSGAVQLRWNSLGSDRSYTVQYSVGLANGSWEAVPFFSWPIQQTNWTDTSASTASSRFYRVVAEPLTR
jgi:hypothetical protein